MIAVIPRTTGTMLWEPAHRGAESAALKYRATIYWNAPTREDDVAGQIALIQHVTDSHYQGIVIAPDQSLALITPIRRAVASGLPTVVIGSRLPIPAGGKLSYILNDEAAGGRIAAQRVALLLHGTGSVAILGVNPDISGIMVRAHSFEQFLAQNYPNIHVVDKRMGSFNLPHEQQAAEEVLKTNPGLNAIVALMWASTRGALATIESNPAYSSVKVIGFDPEAMTLTAVNLDSFVMENAQEMGDRAVSTICDELDGKPVPAVVELEPMLVTRQNINSPEVGRWGAMDYRPMPLSPNRSVNP